MLKDKILYAAGLFDGEGCVSTLYPSRKQVRLEIQMVNKPTLEYFAEIVGGFITKGYEARGNRRTRWRWRVCDNAAVEVAKLLYPHSVEKREQLEALIKFRESTTEREKKYWASIIKNSKRKEFLE